MSHVSPAQIASELLRRAKSLGADLAGFAAVDQLKTAPSFTFAPQMRYDADAIGSRKSTLGLPPGEVAWPENARTVMVIAVHHPEDQPEMDWWFGRIDPPGNKTLARIVRELCDWLRSIEIGVVHLPYHVEQGGTYLKDAAVLAGLGAIGRNNILVTPQFGPRVRLRALTLDLELRPTGPTAFDPCQGCAMPCRRACGKKAFAQQIYTAERYGQDILPGREGVFSRPACNIQMDEDNDVASPQQVEGYDEPVKIIKYCRRCELSCPVGKPLPQEGKLS